MQRFKSEDWDVIISLDVTHFKTHFPQDAVFINPTGTVTVTGPVHRYFFEKLPCPSSATRQQRWSSGTGHTSISESSAALQRMTVFAAFVAAEYGQPESHPHRAVLTISASR